MSDVGKRERLLAKIHKLMKFGNDARGNEHEMETALRQAAKLMAEHGISEAEADMAALDEGSMVFGEVYARADGTENGRSFKEVRKYAQWLAVGVARFTDTIARITHDEVKGAGLKFQGEKNDVVMARWLFGVLAQEVLRATRESEYRNPNFRLACAGRVAERLKQAAKERHATINTAAQSGSRALVVVDRKQAEIAQRFGPEKYTHGRARRETLDMIAGRAAGNRININRHRPIENSRASARIGASK